MRYALRTTIRKLLLIPAIENNQLESYCISGHVLVPVLLCLPSGPGEQGLGGERREIQIEIQNTKYLRV